MIDAQKLRHRTRLGVSSSSTGGHTGVVNSKAFEVAGTTMDSPDPDDGKLYREDGTNSRARG